MITPPEGNVAHASVGGWGPKQYLGTFPNAPVASFLFVAHINVSMTFPTSRNMLSPMFVPSMVLVFSKGCPCTYCMRPGVTTTSYLHFKLWSPMINSVYYS